MKKALLYLYLISFFFFFLPLCLLGFFPREFLGYLELKTPPEALAPGETLRWGGWRLEFKGADLTEFTPGCLTLRAYAPQVEILCQKTDPQGAASPLPLFRLKNFPASRLGKTPGIKNLKIESPLVLSFSPSSSGAPGSMRLESEFSGQKDFTFWVVGDPHYGWIGRKEILPQILNEARSRKPDFLVVAGDLTASGKKEQFAEIAGLLEKTGFPVYTVPGNHDLMDQTLFSLPLPPEAKLSPPGVTLYRRYFGPNYYDFKVGGRRLLFWDTAYGKLYPGQLPRLKSAESNKALWFLHIPPFEPRPFGHHGFLTDEAVERFLSVFSSHKPQAVFTAHIHGSYLYRLKGVPFYISGGAGAPLIGDPETHGFFHYLEVQADPEQISAQTHRIGEIGTPMQYRILNRVVEPLCWELYCRRSLKIAIRLITLLMFLGLIYLGIRKDKKKPQS